MIDILDRIFPEEEQPEDLLAGLPDYTHGLTKDYFGRLDFQDRELVQWYLQQKISPIGAGVYAHDLGIGYAIVDPLRVASEAMEAAHEELARIKRYLTIFTGCPDFFPWINDFNIAVKDEAGRVQGSTTVQGWGRFASKATMELMIQDTQARTIPIVDMTDLFIDDPSSVPLLFNQDEILRQHNDRLRNSQFA